MLIPSVVDTDPQGSASLSRRVNANSQLDLVLVVLDLKLIKKGEC